MALKGYIHIGAAAKMMGVSIKTLRVWDKKGILRPYKNEVNKYRMYKPEELHKILENSKK